MTGRVAVQVPSRAREIIDRSMLAKPSVMVSLVWMAVGGRTVNGADAADQADGIAVADEEAQWILPFVGGVVVCPEVETTGRGHRRGHVSLSRRSV